MFLVSAAGILLLACNISIEPAWKIIGNFKNMNSLCGDIYYKLSSHGSNCCVFYGGWAHRVWLKKNKKQQCVTEKRRKKNHYALRVEGHMVYVK